MQIVMIHGQNHRGSTYHIGRLFADAIGGSVTEFFLPRDFGSFCVGCCNCFMHHEAKCPHYARLKPITDAIDAADVLILTSPVYVYHVTGSMKVFLDHYGYRWMVHRPEASMFHKQAVCITTAAGAGMRSTLKDMAHSKNIPVWCRSACNLLGRDPGEKARSLCTACGRHCEKNPAPG